jgi:signal transduction histidine kinase
MSDENPFSRFRVRRAADKRPQGNAARDSGMPEDGHSFSGLRAFSGLSLLAIVVTALIMAISFRNVSISGIRIQSEAANLIVIEAEAGAIVKPFLNFLTEREAHGKAELPEAISSQLLDLQGRSSLRHVTLIDEKGQVLFSTRADNLSRQFDGDKHFKRAINGKISTKLTVLDVVNEFLMPSGDDNIAQTFYPLRTKRNGKALGVMILATDVTTLVERSAQAQFLFISTALLIMLLFYFSLIAIVRRIENVINQQQIEINQRSNLLAALSRRMIDNHEAEKKQVAAELHERVAQTLAATKMEIESAVMAYRRGTNPQDALERLVPVLHAATQDVRRVATEIHPGSLEDFGLVTTLRTRLAEFRKCHPHIDVAENVLVTRDDIPNALNNITYRVFIDVLSTLAAEESVGRILVELAKINGALTLTIRDDGLTLAEDNAPYQSIFDKTQLSGGKFSLAANDDGGLTLSVSWLA